MVCGWRPCTRLGHRHATGQVICKSRRPPYHGQWKTLVGLCPFLRFSSYLGPYAFTIQKKSVTDIIGLILVFYNTRKHSLPLFSILRNNWRFKKRVLSVARQDGRERPAPEWCYHTLISHIHNMPRVRGSQERTARWNNSDDAKFRSLVDSGHINIKDITPAFIETIRTRHGWDNRSTANFRQNYRRVAKTFRLAQDFEGARERTGESCWVFLSFSSDMMLFY